MMITPDNDDNALIAIAAANTIARTTERKRLIANAADCLQNESAPAATATAQSVTAASSNQYFTTYE